MFLKNKTKKRELICENVLSFMSCQFERKNPCSYLIYYKSKPSFMLFVGKKGVKVKGMIGINQKDLNDFKVKFESCFQALSAI